MIFDNTWIFADSQAITATGDVPSTNTKDLLPTGTVFGASAPLTRDIGRGGTLPLAVLVTQTFNNLTSLQVQVQTSPDNVTWTTIESGRDVQLATLVAGHQFKSISQIPEGTNVRYVRLNFRVTGTAPTTGKITAGVVAARQTNLTNGGN